MIGALLSFGCALGLMLALLAPSGLVEARDAAWGPDRATAAGEVVGYPADRAGGECGLARLVDGVEVERSPIRGCRSYQASAVVRLGDRRLIVWEHADQQVAISTLDGLAPGATAMLPRPTTAAGTLLPRTDVRGEGDRLAVWYHGDHVVSVGADLSSWPGGLPEVAGVRFGARAWTLLLGVALLLGLCFFQVVWTIRLPRALAAKRACGHTLEVVLPERGRTVVVGGIPVVLELERAWTHAAKLGDLAGQTVTLVLRECLHAPGAYRVKDHVSVAQIWPGRFDDAVAHARAMRTGSIAFATAVAAVLAVGLDAYLAF